MRALNSLLAILTLVMLPRVLQRPSNNHSRTRIQTFNCRTLLDDERLNELDIALSSKGIDICALQETRRDGFFRITTGNFVVYTFGEVRGKSGVGFAIHKRLAHLVTAARGIPNTDGRIMLVDMLLYNASRSTTLVCSYSPTNSSSSAVRNKFYTQLAKIATPNCWLLGDFNARVGRRINSANNTFGGLHSNVVGPWSLKNDITPNDNGSAILNIARTNNLRHVGSHFNMRDSKRWTWRHMRYRTRTVLDHVFIPASHMRFISRCFTPADFSMSSDHRPVICELSFRPKTTPKPEKCPPPLNLRALHQEEVKQAFQSDITTALSDSDPSTMQSTDLASTIRTVTVNSANKTIPAKAKPKFPEEFSPETIVLINRKRKMWKFLQKSGVRITRSTREKYRSLCKDTKRAIKRDRNANLEREASELAIAFNQDRFKGYSLLKRMHRSRSKAVLPPESDFTEHYRAHYNLGNETPLTVDSCELPTTESEETLSQDDFDAGVRALNSNRSAGHDGVAPEYIKCGGPVLLHWIFLLMQRIWTFACELPSADRLGSLIPIPKKAGGTVVSCFRPICLLTSLYKLYAILVLHKVRDRVKDFVSWTQAGFIRGRSCGNNLWILRRVSERAIEFNTPVYCLLIDYKGAFDALNRTTLSRILSLFLSPSMVRRVMCLYFDAKANVRIDNICGPAFDLLRGVRQGCPASPSFFTVALAFVSWSFRVAFSGIKLVHFHLSCMEYADDQIIFTLTPEGLQEMIDFITQTAAPLGLRLAPDKCELICFHRLGSIDKNALPVIKLGDMIVRWKSSVVYLGSRFAEDGCTLSAVKHRICCADTVVTRLNPRIFCRRAVDHRLKGQFISTAVFASLLYGLQYCAFSKRDTRCLDGYYLRLVKRVCFLPFDYHLSYEEALQRVGVERPSICLARERLRWAGHVLRSEDKVLYDVLIFEPENGKRGRGKPRLRFYDTLKADLKARDINVVARNHLDFWESLAVMAADRLLWRNEVVLGKRS